MGFLRWYRKTPTVVTKVTIQDSGQHERLVEQFIDSRFVRLDSNNAVSSKRTCAWRTGLKWETITLHDNTPSARSLMDCNTFLMMTGLKTLS